MIIIKLRLDNNEVIATCPFCLAEVHESVQSDVTFEYESIVTILRDHLAMRHYISLFESLPVWRLS